MQKSKKEYHFLFYLSTQTTTSKSVCVDLYAIKVIFIFIISEYEFAP
jgi:hypothetical protein